MAKKNSRPAEAVKTRARRAAPKTAAPKKLADATSMGKKAVALQPPKKLFNATDWFGAFPELRGPTLTIQRKLRDEW